jgi:hypothetical protein
MPDKTAVLQPSDREAAAAYVASLAGELAAIARDHRLETLCYLLEMAQIEARSQSLRPPADD